MTAPLGRQQLNGVEVGSLDVGRVVRAHRSVGARVAADDVGVGIEDPRVLDLAALRVVHQRGEAQRVTGHRGTRVVEHLAVAGKQEQDDQRHPEAQAGPGYAAGASPWACHGGIHSPYLAISRSVSSIADDCPVRDWLQRADPSRGHRRRRGRMRIGRGGRPQGLRPRIARPTVKIAPWQPSSMNL